MAKPQRIKHIMINRFLEKLFVSDSGAVLKPTMHTPSALRGVPKDIEAAVIQRGMLVAATAKLPWRFWVATFHKDSEGNEFHDAVLVDGLVPCESTKAYDVLEKIVVKCVNDADKSTFITYGWIAVCSEVIDLWATEDQFVEQFRRDGVFNKELVRERMAIRKLGQVVTEDKCNVEAK